MLNLALVLEIQMLNLALYFHLKRILKRVG